MLKWLFRGRRKSGGNDEPSYIHRYPPFPSGIPNETLDYILQSQNEVILEIIKALGLAGLHNKEKAERMVLDPIRHYAALVHLLPASEDSFYKSTGGLFRFGLVCGLNAIRIANRRVLGASTPENRKQMEELWTYAAFLGGVYSEAVTTISMVSVYSDRGDSWHPGAERLTDWLIRLKVKNYQITWSKAQDRNMAKTIAGKTIAAAQAQHLASGEKEILPTLMSALFDIDDLSNPIAKIINGIRTRMIMKDLAGDSQRYGKPVAGMHLAPWLIDSMRHLLVNQHWRVNEGMGRVWYGLDGVYLVWPLAANDLRMQLKTNNSPFVPSTIEILAEILMGADIIVGNGDGGSYLFDIGVPQAESAELKYFSAVRLSNPEVLFREQPGSNEPLKMVLGVRALELADVSGWVEVEAGDVADTGHDGVVGGDANKAKFVPDLPNPTPVPNIYDDDYASQYGDGPNEPGAFDAEEAILFLTGKTKEIKKKPAKTDVDRGALILASLKMVKKKHISRLPDGVTRVDLKGVEEAGLDPKDCVDVLKGLGVLMPVDGEDVGVDRSKGSGKRYFLVKVELDGA